jgi:hypothetical protein
MDAGAQEVRITHICAAMDQQQGDLSAKRNGQDRQVGAEQLLESRRRRKRP